MQESDLPPPEHESTDVGIQLVWYGVPAVLLGVVLLSWLVMELHPGDTTDRTLQLPLPRFPAPELQSDPVDDMNRLRASQLAQLDSVGWVDAARHIAHIPIDEAMRQIAREGIADWPMAANEDADAHSDADDRGKSDPGSDADARRDEHAR